MTIYDKSNKNQKKYFFTHVDQIDITGAHMSTPNSVVVLNDNIVVLSGNAK